MRKLFVFLILWACVVCPGAMAQEQGAQEKAEDINIDLFVNYRYAFRDATWVPVDVVVSNNLRDVEGYVEVRTFGQRDLQSPRYRISAQSPKSSRKRFRFYCYLDGTTRVEAMLYHKGRAVSPVAPYLDVQPIEKDDLMGLIIDSQPSDYGFLNMAMQSRGDGTLRFYREEVRPEAVGLLPDHSACFEPYDCIILGDVDPETILPQHRRLIARYVRDGGVLIACAGANAAAYRNTWVEEFAGVRIGGGTMLKGNELAPLVLAEEAAQSGARDTREGLLSELTPIDPDVEVFEHNATIATLRPVGRGYVAMFAVDAASHLLQDTPGFQAMWRDFCTTRRDAGELNFEEATQQYWQRLPYVSGVRLYSKASVISYLLLYFIVGIVLNWLFFSYIKRRELAWVVMLVVSVGFTSYAVLFGTAGRAKSTTLEELQVVRVPLQESAGPVLASVQSTVSLLAARTSRHTLGLTTPHALAIDVASVSTRPGQYGPYGGGPMPQGSAPPFSLREDAAPRIEDFLVGASEMRMFRVLGDLPVEGGVTGTLQYDGRDGLSGTLKNETGLPLDVRGFVLVNGKMYSAAISGDAITVNKNATTQRTQLQDPNMYMYSSPTDPVSLAHWEEQERNKLRQAFSEQLFVRSASQEDYLQGMGNVQGPGYPTPPQDPENVGWNERLGPYLIAWTRSETPSMVDFDVGSGSREQATLLVADIRVEGAGEHLGQRLLPVGLDGMPPTIFERNAGALDQFLPGSSRGNSVEAYIHIPPIMARDESAGPVYVHVYFDVPSEDPLRELYFRPQHANREWAVRNRVNDVEEAGLIGGNTDGLNAPPGSRVSQWEHPAARTFLVEDWRDHYVENWGMIPGKLRSEEVDLRRGNYLVSAEISIQHGDQDKEWKAWQ